MNDRKFKESMAELYLLMHDIDMISLRSYVRCCVGALEPIAVTANDVVEIDDVWAITHYR